MTLRTSAFMATPASFGIVAATLASLARTSPPRASLKSHAKAAGTAQPPTATPTKKVHAGINITGEHGAAKKVANGELAAAKSGKKLVGVNDKASAKKDGNKAGIKGDGHHGTLRVQHHIAQRGSAGVSFHRRLARDD